MFLYNRQKLRAIRSSMWKHKNYKNMHDAQRDINEDKKKLLKHRLKEYNAQRKREIKNMEC